MSGEGELDAIKREFEDAKKTARVYLRAVEVLDPDKISATKNREREIGRMAVAHPVPWTQVCLTRRA